MSGGQNPNQGYQYKQPGLPPATYLEFLNLVSVGDVNGLMRAEQSYGDSWKRRGGIGAFMMLARKWDRIEKQVGAGPERWDIFEHIARDSRAEGIIDDIRDLRRYLLLVEAEMQSRGIKLGKQRDNEAR